MAVAAFKSTSRRATTTTSAVSDKEPSSSRDYLPSSPKKGSKAPPPRRSRSVSAPRRSNLDTSSSDFLLTTRENPLYWTTVSSPPDKDEVAPKITAFITPEASNRGRSVSRNVEPVKQVGRSLSRVDTGRRNRSVSRGPVSRGYSVNSESEVEQESSFLRKNNSRTGSNSVSSVGRKSNVAGKNSSDRIHSRTGSNVPATVLTSSPVTSWEDGVLGRNSFLEAEEKTIKAVSEQMKTFEGDGLGSNTSSQIYETVRSEVRRAIADIQNDLESAIRRSNAAVIATSSVADIPPDLVNPSAVELVLDIRREYAYKLEESRERARKLRADLAVEEHRGLELSRILKEVLPDPKTPSVQKSRPGRKLSIERRRMSKRLSEEAMAYFDECVSLSTFDSSDLSSQEDPPINMVGNGTPFSSNASFSQTSSSTRASNFLDSFPNNDKQQEPGGKYNHYASGLSATGDNNNPAPDEIGLSSSETQWGRRSQFSFSHNTSSALELQQDIRKYVQNIEKDDVQAHGDSAVLRSNNKHLDESKLRASTQSLLFDKVLFQSRIESGSMLLCGGSMPITSLPFSSVI